MAVMQIGPMRMGMFDCIVVVRMAVRLARRVIRPMMMLVMFIVRMAMRVIENVMSVDMEMPLREMQPCTQSHKQTGHH